MAESRQRATALEAVFASGTEFRYGQSVVRSFDSAANYLGAAEFVNAVLQLVVEPRLKTVTNSHTRSLRLDQHQRRAVE